MEVDGPFHFLTNSRTPNGPTLLKRKQLGQLGYKMVPVPFWEWQALKGTKAKQRYLEDKLGGLVEGGVVEDAGAEGVAGEAAAVAEAAVSGADGSAADRGGGDDPVVERSVEERLKKYRLTGWF